MTVTRFAAALAWSVTLLVLPRVAPGAEKFTPFTSDVMRGRQAARHVKLRVAGVKDLWLIAIGVPNSSKGYSDWGDAKLTDAKGKVTYLSDLTPAADNRNYGGVFRDKRQHGAGPIVIGDRTFKRGIGTHADCEICYRLDGRYEWFEAWIGIDAATNGRGNVQFTVSDKPRGIGVGKGAGANKGAVKKGPGPIDTKALRRAIADLTATFPKRYLKGKAYIARLDAIETSLKGKPGRAELPGIAKRFDALRTEALLDNPLLDFEKLLVVKRRPFKAGKAGNPDKARGWDIGFPRSSFGKSSLKRGVYESEIAAVSLPRGGGKPTTLYRPERNGYIGDLDLHHTGERMLFTMRDGRGNLQVHEIGTDGKNVRQVSRGDQVDVHNYDACYLPCGDMVFLSTACFQGVPCNKSNVAVLYRMAADGSGVRQLCFEQDHDFTPTVLENGRVMYLRWEYSDLPHTFSRIMFQMNPDGTGQIAHYGSNSYWPNSCFSAKGIPGRPTMFAGIVAGHHESYRTGELVLFDVSRGRREAEGVVQRIPGYGKAVEPILKDKLTQHSWPKFAAPWPLGDASDPRTAGKYFLVTAKLDRASPWAVYLVDVFDNIVLLHHAAGWGLFEPIPFRKTLQPRVIPDKIDPGAKDATVVLTDVYRGPGLAGVPRGTVKKLRLITYHFCYQGLGGQYDRVGLDGPWDVRHVLGTVPVEPDGSAAFRVPANMPIGVQPLDDEGKALQMMRSWFVGMPGEVVSCIGCHEPPNTISPIKPSLAGRRGPSEITPFYGPRRGFSFAREVQPVVDRYCVGCHNGAKRRDGRTIPDLRTAPEIRARAGHFTPSYMTLRKLVRTGTLEPDMHMLAVGDLHADTTELVQMLRKGHHGVKLSAEAWDRLITWIDLSTPAHGTWRETAGDKRVLHQAARRRALLKLYANRDDDPEAIPKVSTKPIKPIVPDGPDEKPAAKVTCEGWPFAAAQAAAKQAAAGKTTRTIDLGQGVTLHLVRIPAGRFVMGDPAGEVDERPAAAVTIDNSFWMGKFEITNAQYALFDRSHDSRLEYGDSLHFERAARGFPLSGPDQPVARVSWNRATAFCRWLSAKTGLAVALPTEAQWEWACRAGSDTPLSYGQTDADFARYANLADATFRRIVNYGGYDNAAGVVPDWRPACAQVDDRHRVSAAVGRFAPNAWGLHDMHGNVAEWTQSALARYPYRDADGRNAPGGAARRVVRGGSWYDRPKRARSAFRLAYRPYLGVYNVGFRVVCTEGGR